MRTLRQLPWWFTVSMLIGLAGIATGVALIAHGMQRHPRHATEVSQNPAAPDVPVPVPPAGPPVPEPPSKAPVGGRPRSTPTRPAASVSSVPTPYRSVVPAGSVTLLPTRRETEPPCIVGMIDCPSPSAPEPTGPSS